MSRFVDRTTIHIAAGDGGNGCASVRREKFKPLAGSDGGNGGRGGDVRLVVDPGVHTLLDFRYRPNAEASSGTAGKGNNRHGAAGEDLVLPVPEGTVVLNTDGEVLTDLVGAGTSFTAGVGGGGGLGNAALVSKARKHPGFALLGEPGERKDLVLEVKSVADVGLLGFPSAGKSSLISALSAARPKIADYPFTTLAPNLGVVTAEEKAFTIADVPGLLPGASEGRGLGQDFLRHIERCAVLAHVVDCATLEPGRDPLTDVDTLEQELAHYTPSLGAEVGIPDISERPRVVVLNKIDVPEARELADLVRPELEQRGWRVFEISTATHEGLRQLSFDLAEEVERFRAQLPPAEPPRVTVRPKSVADNDFTVERDAADADAFVVRGNKPERWVRQTNFDNNEAVSFLGDRLARIGVEEELARQGAQSGSQVTIGEMTFDWEPSTPVGLAALDRDDRVSADARKLAKEQRRTSLDAAGAYVGPEEDDLGADELAEDDAGFDPDDDPADDDPADDDTVDDADDSGSQR